MDHPKMQGTDKTTKKLSSKQPATTNTQPSSSTTGASDSSTPKNHTNVIIGLIILVICILFGGAFLTWYSLAYSNPNTIAADAMRQFLSARQLTTKGTVQTLIASGSDEYRAQININSQANQADNYTTVNFQTLLGDYQLGETDNLNIELGLIKLTNGDLYLQIANVLDTIDQYLAADDTDIDDLDNFSQLAYYILDVIDGEWWEISLPDILEAVGFDSDVADPIDAAYDCVMQVAAQDHSREFIEAYKNAPFLEIAKTDSDQLQFDGFDGYAAEHGSHYYRVTIDHEQLANFLNQVLNGEASMAIEACYREYQQAVGQEPSEDSQDVAITASDLQKALPDDLEIYLEITNWAHQLQGMIIYTTNGPISLSANFRFDYQAPTITAPESYRPVTDFAEELENTIERFSMYNSYYGNGTYYINDGSWS